MTHTAELTIETPTDWDDGELPEEVRDHPLLEESAWIELRDSGRDPLDASPMVTTYQSRAEFLVGAWIISELVPRRIIRDGLLGNLQPQMLRTADVLAADRFANAILEPRRSAKTTAIWCVLLGRCWKRSVYMAGYTMLTTAQKAGERFKLDVRDPITRKWRNPKESPVKLNGSNGALGVEFDNGSKLSILSPNGDAVRSGAYDVLVMDEGGEAEPEMWDDIVGAVVPSFDTRGEGAQLVYAGTGGKYRDGSHFWATLHDPDAGRLRYGVPDDYDEANLQTWDAVRPLIERMHPGLDGLTRLDVIQRNFAILGWFRFAMEYLGHFGHDSGNASLMSATAWEESRVSGPVPEGITPLVLTFAVHLGGAWASIGVGWLVDDDRPVDLVTAAMIYSGDAPAAAPRPAFKLIHHQAGNAGLAMRLWELHKALDLPIVYDDSPQENAIVQELERMSRVARRHIATDKVRYAEKAVATTKLLNGIDQRNALHWEQQPLDDAQKVAIPRISGKARLIGAASADDDVTPLDAFALALLRMPDAEPEESFGPIMAA